MSNNENRLLDLSELPPIFVLPTHLNTEELLDIEYQLEECKARLTYDALEAKLFLGTVQQKRRAIFELHSRNVRIQDVADGAKIIDKWQPSRKKRRTRGSLVAVEAIQAPVSTLDDPETDSDSKVSPGSLSAPKTSSRGEPILISTNDRTMVIKLSWFEDSKKAGYLLPLQDYLVYEGVAIAKQNSSLTTLEMQTQCFKSRGASRDNAQAAVDILSRAQDDGLHSKVIPPNTTRRWSKKEGPDARFADRPFSTAAQQSHKRTSYMSERASILREDTSEFEDRALHDLPDMPEWVKAHSKYSCERATPIDNPNQKFIAELKKIVLARLLTGDQIGVRAYSTSIAAIAAYPYLVSSPREIIALPGCDLKIANLWSEWHENGGRIAAAEDAEKDETLKVIRLFYEIWGVGDKTAREFYFDRGWRDLDDIVEHGWNTLSRVQQIGVKFYEEFQEKIPRAEAELIAAKIHDHALRVRGDGVETCIVGGYRRGMAESGDVDVIVSHRDQEKTSGIVKDIVASLEADGHITHTLKISLNTTNRGQATLPYRMDGGGHGFDSLDKALVVWQDNDGEEKNTQDSKARNSKTHRRVDIIVTPWRTVGCAVMGWSGGTTFQRDLRRYAKEVKGWKFDSSGVRDRATGAVVDLEGDPDGKTSCEEAEKRVFEGLGLVYREPWERCTG